MIDYIWAGLMLCAIVFGVACSRGAEVTQALFSGAGDAVTLCMTLCGTVCFFSGLMKVAEKAGITRAAARAMKPLFKLLFKGLDPNGAAAQAICMNISANVMGLGNAATPFGLEAMKRLHEQSGGNVASDHMITFVVLNTASIQLIPTTIAVLRAKYQSAEPMDIITAIWIASAASLTAGLVFAALLNRVSRRRRK